MAKHHIALNGCDDSTHFDIDLTPSEMKVVHRILGQIDRVPHGGCRPTITVDPEECATEPCFFLEA